MTNPKNDGVKRWNYRQIQAAYNSTDMQHPLYIEAADHDRKVAGLYESEAVKLSHIEDLELQVCRLESKLATARKVIEKLKRQRNYYCDLARMHDKSYQEHVEDCDAEIEAIERGES